MLLDVNCLLAIAWPNHQHHNLVRVWFLNEEHREWRTCAVTELGFIRLSANPAFTPEAVRPPEAVELLAELKKRGNHCYIDSPTPTIFPIMRHESIQGHRQTTDAYLLSLAGSAGCKFVTLDNRISHLATASKNLLILE